MEEMVMAALQMELEDREEVRGLLGLDESVFDGVLAELVRKEHVWLSRDGNGRVSLTPAGHSVLREAQEVVPEDTPLEIHFDGLTRQIVPFVGDLMEPRRLKEAGMREVPPARAKPPELSDLDLDAIQQIALRLRSQRDQTGDLLALKRIDRRARGFRPAVLLMYRSVDSGEIQISFAVDEQISEEHEAAFSKARLAKKMGIVASAVKDATRLSEAIFERPLTAEQGRVSPEPDRAGSRSASKDKSKSRTAVSILETYAHPQYLKTALTKSSERLLILSPWITHAVVDRTFTELLEKLLTRGTRVYIGWGLSKDEEAERNADPRSLRLLEKLADKDPNLSLERLGGLHAKVLVSDQAFGVVTSFNWLSFKGDPTRTFRDERGMLVTAPQLVDELFQKSVARFATRGQSGSAGS
jgi:DNA-binding MarR family transcriptional regulator